MERGFAALEGAALVLGYAPRLDLAPEDFRGRARKKGIVRISNMTVMARQSRRRTSGGKPNDSPYLSFEAKLARNSTVQSSQTNSLRYKISSGSALFMITFLLGVQQLGCRVGNAGCKSQRLGRQQFSSRSCWEFLGWCHAASCFGLFQFLGLGK